MDPGKIGSEDGKWVELIVYNGVQWRTLVSDMLQRRGM
jgi:hypothetical protein